MTPEKKFVTRWTGGIAVAFVIGYFLPLGVLGFSNVGFIISGVIRGAVLFGFIGLVHGYCLHERNSGLVIKHYAAYSAAAGALMYGAWHWQLMSDPDSFYSWSPGMNALRAFGAGAWIGGVQGWAMRYLLRQPATWPITVGIAFAVAFGLESLVLRYAFGMVDDAPPYMFQAVSGVLVCTIIGGITGVAALKLTQPGETDEQPRRADETGEEHRG